MRREETRDETTDETSPSNMHNSTLYTDAIHKLCAHSQSSYASYTPMILLLGSRANNSVYLAVSQQATSVFPS